ncbi:hypothetical protein P59_215 [Bacillus phage P59]|nr:hypothetical protein P59_215 [Bacillus phage P59]
MDREDWGILIAAALVVGLLIFSIASIFIWEDQCLHVSSSLEKSVVAPCTKR